MGPGTTTCRRGLASLVAAALLAVTVASDDATTDTDNIVLGTRHQHTSAHHHDHSSHHHSHDNTTEVITLGGESIEEDHKHHEKHLHDHDGTEVEEVFVLNLEDGSKRTEEEDAVVAAVARLASIPASTWLAALSSVLCISVAGLLTVAVLPLLAGPHQNTALQLLVALAVGTLVGDALMHLLPHALNTDHGDTDAVWKGFAASVTIILFWALDRVLEGAGHGHTHGHAHSSAATSETGSGEDVEKLTVSTRTSRESTPVTKTKSVSSLYSLYERDRSYQALGRASCCSMPPSSLMVIVGDAVHNFADGIAVGAAFSMSLAAGFSTSIAVLCHELPHEVGDFALLLHSGMSVKVAILYNCVSSVFAFVGLVAGLVLGAQGAASSWLLAGTVGVFLYVAMVSMMSELRGGDWRNAALNTLGMLAGAVLLLFIGLYEHDLILLFEDSPHADHTH